MIGSIVTSAYKSTLAPAHNAVHIAQAARQSLGAATQIVHHLPAPLGHELAIVTHHAFVHAADRGLLAAAAVTLAGLITAARALPGPERASQPSPGQQAASASA